MTTTKINAELLLKQNKIYTLIKKIKALVLLLLHYQHHHHNFTKKKTLRQALVTMQHILTHQLQRKKKTTESQDLYNKSEIILTKKK